MKKTIKKKGKKPITFQVGGLHASLGIPMSQHISATMMREALAGEFGPKAKKQAQFKKNVLTGPKKKRKSR